MTKNEQALSLMTPTDSAIGFFATSTASRPEKDRAEIWGQC